MGQRRASTHFLYAMPSFWEGWARTIDLGDTLTEFNGSPDERLADYYALRSDWYVIGDDLIGVYEQAMHGLKEEAPA